VRWTGERWPQGRCRWATKIRATGRDRLKAAGKAGAAQATRLGLPRELAFRFQRSPKEKKTTAWPRRSGTGSESGRKSASGRGKRTGRGSGRGRGRGLPVTHMTGSALERRETRDITSGLAPPRPSTEEEEKEEAQRVRRRMGTERKVWKGGHSTNIGGLGRRDG
jgi:hypothetical protein